MNIKRKIGLGIMGPLFAFAVGHTVFQKINQDNNNRTEIVNTHNLNLNSMNQQPLALDSQISSIVDMVNKDSNAAERLYSTIDSNTREPQDSDYLQLASDLSWLSPGWR